jgi:hypothetical protein
MLPCTNNLPPEVTGAVVDKPLAPEVHGAVTERRSAALLTMPCAAHCQCSPLYAAPQAPPTRPQCLGQASETTTHDVTLQWDRQRARNLAAPVT